MTRSLCALLTLLSGYVAAGDWPQFRGPDLTGSVSGENIIPGDEFGLEVVWKKSLGSGYACVSIAGEKAVTMFSDESSDILVALNAQTGDELWRYVMGPVYKGHSGSDDGPSSTPTIHDGIVYALDTHGILVAVSLDKGEKIWQRKLGDDLAAHVPHYGFNTVPTVAGSSLIVMTGDKEGRAATALDLKTGKTKWSVGDDTNTYQSPFVWNHEGHSTVLAMTDNHLMGINPDDGTLRWQHDHTLQDGESFGFPLPVGDHAFLLTSLRGAMVLDLDHEGSNAKTRWQENAFMNTYAIPVFHDGYLYGYRAQFMSCVNPADGKVMWRSRPPSGRGLSLIQNMIFSVSNQGDLVAIAANPDEYKETARINIFDQASYTSVSYGAGLVFARNLKEIAAIRITDKPNEMVAMADAKPAVELMGEFGNWVKKVQASKDKKSMINGFLKENKTSPLIEGDVVHYFFSGDVEDLAVSRGFEDEKPMARIEGTNFYYFSEKLDEAGHWEYSYSVYGDQRLDPLNPLVVGEGENAANELRMPKWVAPDYFGEPTGKRGSLAETTLTSKLFEADFPLKVYLPPSYGSSDSQYPLVVVTHESMLSTGKMDRALDNLIGKEIAEVIVAFAPRITGEQAGPRRDDYLAYLGDELIPFINENYRTKKDPSTRLVMGYGRSALLSAYAGLKRPDIAGNFSIQSFVYMPPAGEDTKTMLGEATAITPRFIVEVSTNDYDFPGFQAEADSRDLVAQLTAKGAKVTQLDTAGSPSWSGWRGSVGRILKAVYPVAQTN